MRIHSHWRFSCCQRVGIAINLQAYYISFERSLINAYFNACVFIMPILILCERNNAMALGVLCRPLLCYVYHYCSQTQLERAAPVPASIYASIFIAHCEQIICTECTVGTCRTENIQFLLEKLYKCISGIKQQTSGLDSISPTTLDCCTTHCE